MKAKAEMLGTATAIYLRQVGQKLLRSTTVMYSPTTEAFWQDLSTQSQTLTLAMCSARATIRGLPAIEFLAALCGFSSHH